MMFRARLPKSMLLAAFLIKTALFYNKVATLLLTNCLGIIISLFFVAAVTNSDIVELSPYMIKFITSAFKLS